MKRNNRVLGRIISSQLLRNKSSSLSRSSAYVLHPSTSHRLLSSTSLSSSSLLLSNTLKSPWSRRYTTAAASPQATTSAPPPPAAAAAAAGGQMFCFQCQQTKDNTGCVTVGDCGKNPEVAALQDLLIHQCKTLSLYATELRQVRKKLSGSSNSDLIAFNRWINDALFSTLTNVNFDEARMKQFLREGQQHKEKLQALYHAACAAAKVSPTSPSAVMQFDYKSAAAALSGIELSRLENARSPNALVGVLAKKAAYGDDYNGLHELCLDGLKGMSAYTEHACRLGKEADEVYEFIQETLAFLAFDRERLPDVGAIVQRALSIGKHNVQVMAMLDAAHVETYGHPVPTKVSLVPVPGKAILVTGHDIKNLSQLLEQTKDKGINVYTHGELLPAHAYPSLKQKYPHLIGNFGGAWQHQQFDFSMFPGPIVVTTNCIIEPRKSYKSRVFTLNSVGWPGCTHIADADYSKVIQLAKSMNGFMDDDIPKEEKFTMTGFGRNAVLSIADVVVNAVKRGDIKHFFLIGGCDGASSQRSYFRDLALKTPKDSVVLTLACGKYRFNSKFSQFGTIKTKTADNAKDVELPRLLDMGQCNDAYSAIKVAEALANAFGTNVNALPLSFAISWFEQKAVAVLLSLLHLNIHNIYLGPSLPAFVTPNMLKLLQQNFHINATGDVDENLSKMLGKQ